MEFPSDEKWEWVAAFLTHLFQKQRLPFGCLLCSSMSVGWPLETSVRSGSRVLLGCACGYYVPIKYFLSGVGLILRVIARYWILGTFFRQIEQIPTSLSFLFPFPPAGLFLQKPEARFCPSGDRGEQNSLITRVKRSMNHGPFCCLLSKKVVNQ